MTENEITATETLWEQLNNNNFEQDQTKKTEILKKFIHDFGIDVGESPDYIVKILENAFAYKLADDVEYALSIAYAFNIFSHKFLKVLIDLLLEEWHIKHEDIAFALQKLKSPESINALYEVAQKSFNYDESFSIASKCIWALWKIGTTEAIEKIKILSECNIEEVKQLALKQLRR